MVYLFSSCRTRATLRRGSSLQSTCSSSPTLSELTVLRNYRCHVPFPLKHHFHFFTISTFSPFPLFYHTAASSWTWPTSSSWRASPPLYQESVHWFFPDVQRSTKQPGATLGEYIKAVRKEGGQKRFKDYPANWASAARLSRASPNWCARGMRPTSKRPARTCPRPCSMAPCCPRAPSRTATDLRSVTPNFSPFPLFFTISTFWRK